MNPCVEMVLRQVFQRRPGLLLPSGVVTSEDSNTGHVSSRFPCRKGCGIRLIIGTRPRRAVFNVIVAGHVFGDDGDGIGGIFR